MTKLRLGELHGSDPERIGPEREELLRALEGASQSLEGGAKTYFLGGHRKKRGDLLF